MATDQQAAEAYRRLREHCASLPADRLQSLDDGLDAGEPYLALSWLIADVLENHIDVPSETLLSAYALLDDADKEEYADMLG